MMHKRIRMPNIPGRLLLQFAIRAVVCGAAKVRSIMPSAPAVGKTQTVRACRFVRSARLQ
jgi:hypothetical protein